MTGPTEYFSHLDKWLFISTILLVTPFSPYNPTEILQNSKNNFPQERGIRQYAEIHYPFHAQLIHLSFGCQVWVSPFLSPSYMIPGGLSAYAMLTKVARNLIANNDAENLLLPRNPEAQLDAEVEVSEKVDQGALQVGLVNLAEQNAGPLGIDMAADV